MRKLAVSPLAAHADIFVITFYRTLLWPAIAGWLLVAPAAFGFAVTQPWQQVAGGSAAGPGQPLTITWSLVPDGTETVGHGPSSLISWLDNQFGVQSVSTNITERPWFALLEASFAAWGRAGGLTFRFENVDDGVALGGSPGVTGVRGDIRLGAASIDGIRGTLAFARQPVDGDILIDVDGGSWLLDPTDAFHRFRNMLTHEIGHSIGLDHILSTDSHQLMEAQLDLTIDGPQHDDLRGLHYLFGDRWERDGRNDTTATATDLGVLLPGILVEVGTAPFATDNSNNDLDLLSIARRGDVDVFRITAATSGTVDLQLMPRGSTYLQGLVGEPEVSTNSLASSNLSIELLDLDGSRRQLIDATAAGLAESLRGLQVFAGENLYVAVHGSRDTVQFYGLSLLMHAAVPEPNALRLLLCASAGLIVYWRASLARDGCVASQNLHRKLALPSQLPSRRVNRTSL